MSDETREELIERLRRLKCGDPLVDWEVGAVYRKISFALVLIAMLALVGACTYPTVERGTPTSMVSSDATVAAIEVDNEKDETPSPIAEPSLTSPAEEPRLQVARSREDSVRMASQELSRRLSVSASNIEVIRAERAELSPDQLSSQAEGKEGVSLPAQVLGYEVVLRSGDVQYRFYVYRSLVVPAEGG